MVHDVSNPQLSGAAVSNNISRFPECPSRAGKERMAGFDQYSKSYRFLKLERRDGILQMTVHTDGGPLRWGLEPQAEFARAFAEVGADRENRVIILTGTGDEFSGPRLDPDAKFFHGAKLTPEGIYHVFWNAQRLVHSLLDIEVPIIAAVNGPAMRHADLALMSDIVIAADDVTFEDTAHFTNGSIVPGDGINVVYTLLLGLNRARYLMLTGQVLRGEGGEGAGPRRRADAAREASAARVGARAAAREEVRHAAALYPEGSHAPVATGR